jgi:hypothetical protein
MSDEPYVPPADPMSDRLAWTMVGVFVIICWVAIVLGTWLILTHPDAPADRPGVVATPTTYAPPRVPAPVPAGAR